MKYVTVLILALGLSCIYALDVPKQFIRKLHIEPNNAQDFQSRIDGILSQSNRHLADDSVPECPVCISANNKEQDKETDDASRIKEIVAQVTGMIDQGVALKVLQKAVLLSNSTLVQALPEGSSVSTLVTLLQTAAGHLTAIAVKTQKSQADSAPAVADETSTLIADIFSLLEDVTTGSADMLYRVADIVHVSDAVDRAEAKTIGMVTSVILSTLGLFERASLGIVYVLVEFLNALSGEPVAMESAINTASLRDRLSAGPIGGVFGDVLGFLDAMGDESGLSAVLANAASDMVGVEKRLSNFLYSADNAIVAATTTSERGSSSAIQANTITEILDLIVSIISTILTLIISIITTILDVIVGIIGAVINLIVGIISAIIDLIVSILNAILGIFSVQSDSVQADGIASASAASLLAMRLMGYIVANPSVPMNVANCFLSLDTCLYLSKDELDCNVEILNCQNSALSETLPQI